MKRYFPLLIAAAVIFLLFEAVSLFRSGSRAEDGAAADAYAVFSEAAASGEMEIRFDTKLPGETASDVFFRTVAEHPELFWLKSVKITEFDTTVVTIENDFGLTDDDRMKMLAELEAAAERIVRSIPSYYQDYDKVLYLHDYVTEHTDYAFDKVGTLGLWNTAYGCLVQGSAVCGGYAAAMKLLLDRCGIPCGIAEGIADGVRHSWNYVVISGRYYWLDATWDDSGDRISHDYFLINDEQLYRTRTLETEGYYLAEIPKCRSVEENYFFRNDCYAESYSFQKISIMLRRSGGDAEIMFASADDYARAKRELYDERRINEIVDAGKVEFRFDDRMYIMHISF